MNEQAHREEGSQRAVEGEPRTGAEHQGEGPSAASSLLAARRQLLIGTIGFSAFAATLASRPAFAHTGGGGCGPITALCSPTHSGSHSVSGCTGYHADYWCSDKNRWPVNCHSATFSSCGFQPPPGCNFSGGTRLRDAICSAYRQGSQPRNWSQTYNSSGQQNYSGGWWTYNSASDTNNLACWIACGLLNASSPQTYASFGYDRDGFIAACKTALNSKNPECYTNIHTALCATISSVCTQHRGSSSCGGPSSIWS